jgi:putative bacteriocin precursor
MKKLRKRVLLSNDTIEAFTLPCPCGCNTCTCGCVSETDMQDDYVDDRAEEISDDNYQSKIANIEP